MGIFDDIGEFFFGSDDIEQPALSASQEENIRLQNQSLTQQADLSRLLLPILLSEDFDIDIDDQGNITNITPKPETDLEKSTGEIQNLLAQESLKFLKGEGNVPEQVNSDFAKSREILEESLRKSLGGDFASSTPGADALESFEKTRIETLEGIRFGRLRDVEGLSIARSASGNANRNSELNEFLQALGVAGAPLGGLSTAINQGQFDRSLTAQVDIANRKDGVLGSLFEGVGRGVGSQVDFAKIAASLGLA